MATQQRLGGVTPKGERAARGILDAAIDVIADHGPAGASLRRIAERADVDKRVLRYYFADRDGLLAAVADRIGERLLSEAERALADIVDPGEGFEIGFRVLWGTVTASPRLHAAYVHLVAASISDEALRERVIAVRDRYDALIQERARAAEANGYVWTMDRAAMSALVLAGLQGLTLDYLQRGETPQLAEALREYRAWLAGLAAPPGA